MDLEEFCVQAAGRVKGQLTFQGQVVRLDPKLSVCRQLHHRWLSATGREVSYEEFKRSLRFRMQNGEVAVRMAYDPTKLLVAGLAGVGATAAAFGGYQWWKSRKSGEVKQAAMQCAEPDYSKWENAEALEVNSLDDTIKETLTYTYSDEPIRRVCLGETLIEDGPVLQEIEKAYEVYAEHKPDTELIRNRRLTFKGGVIKKAVDDEPHFRQPKYVGFEGITKNSIAPYSNSGWDKQFIKGCLKENVPIGDQVGEMIRKGVTWVEGEARNSELFLYKQQVTAQYQIPVENKVIDVFFENPSNIKNTSFDFTLAINVNGVTYNLEFIMFENKRNAILHNGHWVIGNLPGEAKNYKKIPNDDLSIVCAIPTEVRYVKEGYHIVD